MRQRTSRVLSQEDVTSLWRELEKRNFTSETSARESVERRSLEAGICASLTPDGKEGWDFHCDHYGPPPFVCRFTLLNKQLHTWQVLHAVLEVFDTYATSWALDLGLVNSIEDGRWTKCEDLARLIITSEEVLIDGQLGLNAVPKLLKPE